MVDSIASVVGAFSIAGAARGPLNTQSSDHSYQSRLPRLAPHHEALSLIWEHVQFTQRAATSQPT